MQKIKIDIWSDIVCPFCYLGKHKLEQAIEKLGLQNRVAIEWHSFQLDPSIPKHVSMPATEHVAQRKGMPISTLADAQQRLSEQGKNYGIDFQFQKSLTFNTHDAHRLLHWAKAFDKATDLKAAFLKAHFTDGVDLSKPDQLTQIAGSVGLDVEAARQVLNSTNYSQEFQNDVTLARQIGINGVPFFVFNGRTALSGAQPDHIFEEVLSAQ